jgi:hypothetical protein
MKKQSKLLFFSLGIIIITGFLLRFWHYLSIPFTFDELSALYRLRFGSLLEVIQQGVMPDTHPAGVQVFLYFWTKWFGMSEYIVKLPFLFLGMGSIFLTFQIGRIWFGSVTGILAAAYVSSLQMFVMYSQIARPYSSGLFFCLLMVYFWSRYFFEYNRIGFLIGFVFAASMATYNHYFSFLFAGIVGLTGLFFVNKKTLVPYLLSGITILILYVPHIPILIHQIELGEVEGVGGWLNKPDSYFIVRFFEWLFHFSFWSFGLFLIIVLSTILWNIKKTSLTVDLKKRIILGLWFLLPLVVGYFLSIYMTPLLQYSTLIFSTPFLFILLFSARTKIPDKILILIVAIILITNSLTLIFTRNYYHLFYKQPFEEVVKSAVKLEEKHPGNVFIIDDYVPFYIEYYFKKYDRRVPYYTVRNKDISRSDFKHILAGIKQNIVITSGLASEYFQIIKQEFPHWAGYDRGFTFEQYVLSKEKLPGIKDFQRKLISELNFEQNQMDWQIDQNAVITDSITNQKFFEFKPETLYGLDFKIIYDSLVKDIYQIIDIELELKTKDTLLDAVIVGEIKSKQETAVWRGSNIAELNLQPGGWQKAFLTIDLQQTLNNKSKNFADYQFTTYIWNRGHNHFLVKDMKIYLRPGNPDRYSLLLK